jgi:hypothetical protein
MDVLDRTEATQERLMSLALGHGSFEAKKSRAEK